MIDVEGGRLQYVNPRFLRYFPSLAVLRFIDNGPGPFQIFNTHRHKVRDSPYINHYELETLFEKNLKLREVDLSLNKIDYLPASIFDKLNRLEQINLSGNLLRAVNFTLAGVRCLRSLQLANNQIEMIGHATRSALDRQLARCGDDIVVDLRNNSIRCQCDDSIHFLEWATRLPPSSGPSVKFVDPTTYSCTMADGNQARLVDVDLPTLRAGCVEAAAFVNGSACPCDAQRQQRLATARLFLVDKWCRVPQPISDVYMPLESAVIYTDQMRYICDGFEGRIIPLFIFSAVLIWIVITTAIVIAVAYRTQRLVCRRKDIKVIIKDYFRLIWRYERVPLNSVECKHFDVFLVYHANDYHFATKVVWNGLVDRLHLKVCTEDNFIIGSWQHEAYAEAFQKSSYVVFVLSLDLIQCSTSLQVLMHAVDQRPGDIVLLSDQPLREVSYSSLRLFYSAPLD